MKRTAPSSPTYSPPPKIPATSEARAPQLCIWELPEEVLGIITAFLTQDELLDMHLTSKQFFNIAEKCFKDLFRTTWKFDINFTPVNGIKLIFYLRIIIIKIGSWCAQFSKWGSDFSQMKHSLPKVHFLTAIS
jgi:hypothetical protein